MVQGTEIQRCWTRSRPPIGGSRMILRSEEDGDFPPFYSILFARPEDRIGVDALQAPEFFADLNCDQIVDAITAGKDDYNLKPFFYACL